MPESMFGRIKRRLNRPTFVIVDPEEMESSEDGKVTGWSLGRVKVGDSVALVLSETLGSEEPGDLFTAAKVLSVGKKMYGRVFVTVKLQGKYVPPLTSKERGDAPEWMQESVDAQFKFPGAAKTGKDLALKLAPQVREAVSQGAPVLEACAVYVDACMADFMEGVMRSGMEENMDELVLAFRGAMILRLLESIGD